MSTEVTYTYSKVLKNPGIMMSTVENVFGPLINYYDYDINTSTLSITFINSLDADKKAALDTLVNVYVENAVSYLL